MSTERWHSVDVRRLPEHPRDEEQFRVSWRLRDEATARRIEVELDAHLAVPRLLPLVGVADHVANGFLNAALHALS